MSQKQVVEGKLFSKISLFSLILLLTLCKLSLRAHASGVFELELVDLQRYDSSSSKSIDSGQTAPIRLLVCLKEAFTSQLDGPCTFGNASITLNQPIIKKQSTTGEQQTNHTIENLETEQYQQVTDTTRTSPQQQLQNLTSLQIGHQVQQKQQQGSLLTNVVRILFTFRWTKSFTIILTAEQISTNDQYQAQNRPQQIAAVRRFTQINSSAANQTTDLSSANKSATDRPASPQLSQSFIDRHVLTENEVLPNLETNPNRPWTSRFSRSLKSSLVYRFRVFCALNYYGDGCTTFCRPRDDQFGHYNCSSTGQKVCLDGWHGLDCDKAKCRSGCNQQHGYCDKPDTCQCRHGWTGPRCDECIVYPGCQNGYCLSPWQCICQRNWGGVFCDQDLNYCGTHDPCKNNGTCQNIAPGRYRCNCPEGFTGINCETSISGMMIGSSGSLAQLGAGCALNPCLNGGTCYGFNSQLVESGQPIPTGDNLESIAELGEDRLYRCQCMPGWTGDYCQWAEAVAAPTDLLNAAVTSNSSNIISLGELPSLAATFVPTVTDLTAQEERPKNESAERLTTESIMTLLESIQTPPTTTMTTHLDMKHLISGVVIASVVGVFLASLLLAWCCLIALERNRFSFIQMNVIKNGDNIGQPVVSTTLRRVQAKIRDSLRCSSRNRIKPETKLSIENVLRPPRPPPSYEESSNYATNSKLNSIEYPPTYANNGSSSLTIEEICEEEVEITKTDNLVIRGALEQKIASKKSQPAVISSQIKQSSTDLVTSAQLTCPRHGHLYRKQASDYHETAPTTIEIEYQPVSAVTMTRQQEHLHHHDTSRHLRTHNHIHNQHPPDCA